LKGKLKALNVSETAYCPELACLLACLLAAVDRLSNEKIFL